MKLYDMMKEFDNLWAAATYAQAGCQDLAREQMGYTASPQAAYQRNQQPEDAMRMVGNDSELPAYTLDTKL